METEIKQLRVAIDTTTKLVVELKPVSKIEQRNVGHITSNVNSEEIMKCIDSLFMAKGHLGKLLGEIGTSSPYGTNYKIKEDIVPTADVAVNEEIETNEHIEELEIEKEHTYNDFNHIEKVEYLRNQIEDSIIEVKQIANTGENLTREFNIHRTAAYINLCEAKMWLGFEFSRIKEEK